jgi:LysR family transcriptional regulator, nod-box dependent transcriptional activator
VAEPFAQNHDCLDPVLLGSNPRERTSRTPIYVLFAAQRANTYKNVAVALGDVDLNLLVTLDALLRERNVTRAGVVLGISQPTMSRALARLRHTFDDPLLVRVGREMQLTPRAQSMVSDVQEILLLAERAVRGGVEFDPATSNREFCISCSDYATIVLMPSVLERVREEAPHVRLHLVPRGESAALLRTGDADIVIEPSGLVNDSSWSSIRAFTDRWRAIVWSQSESARGPMTLRRFRSTPYLAYTLGSRREPNLADRVLAARGLQRTPAVTAENFALVPFLLRGTDLVALVLERGVLAFGHNAPITLLDPPIEIPDVDETLFWSPRNDRDPAHTWLRHTIKLTADAL